MDTVIIDDFMLLSPEYYQNYYTKLEWEVSGENEFTSAEEDYIDVYPNPASDLINIKSDYQIQNIKIYNFLGELLYDVDSRNNLHQINSSQFPSGCYFLHIKTGKKWHSKKIILE